MTKLIFLDFDGPMIPLRAYGMAGQTRPFVHTFDPCAVGLVNELCKRTGAKIVVHSSWRRLGSYVPDIKAHMIAQGLLEEYILDPSIPFTKFSSSRWDDIWAYVVEHKPETYVILEDEHIPDGYTDHLGANLVHINFTNGIMYEDFGKAYEILNGVELSKFVS